MSNDFDSEEFEEIAPEELEKKPVVKQLSDDVPDEPLEEEEVPEEETPEEETKKRTNNFEALNRTRNQNKKANAIRFIKEFTRNSDLTYDKVAAKIGITKEVAKKYLGEYTSAAINSVSEGSFPTGVLIHFNSPSIPPQHRLTAKEIQEMKPILLRYNKVNIDSLLDKDDNDGDDLGLQEQSQDDMDPHKHLVNELVDDMIEAGDDDDGSGRQEKGEFFKYNKFKKERQEINTNPRVLSANSPIVDVIEFGLINSGQIDGGKIRKIKSLFMADPIHYLTDENAFVGILESNGVTSKPLNAFMDFIKHVAPIKPNERIGFLALAGGPQSQQQPGGGGGAQQPGQGEKFNNFNINDYDEYVQFLYHEGIYQYGYPPDHYINKTSYKKYLDDKKQEEEEKKLMRQSAMQFRQNLMMMGRNAMGGPQQQGGGNNMGGPQNNNAYVFDERRMVEQGLLAPEITYDAMGNKTTRLIPTGRTYQDLQQQNGGFLMAQPQKMDELEKNVNMFSKLIEAVTRIMPQQGGGTSSGNPLIDKILLAAIDRMVNVPQPKAESPTEVLQNQMNLFTTFKDVFPTLMGTAAKQPTEIDVQLKKIETDAGFMKQEIDLKRELNQIERERLEKQESESKTGLESIFGMIQKGVEMFMPTIQSLLSGQIGGGLNQMIPPQPPQQTILPQQETTLQDDTGGFGPPPQYPNVEFPMQQQDEYLPPGFQPQQSQSQQQPQEPQPQQFTPPPDFMPQQVQPQPIPTQEELYSQVPVQQVSENEFINNITQEDLATLSPEQLEEIADRIESKKNKLASILNEIKSTKAKKQFGYSSTPRKKQVQQQPPVQEYKELDVPPDMNPDYDGIDESKRYVEPEPVTSTEQQQQQPSIDIEEEVSIIEGNHQPSMDDIAKYNKDFSGQPIEEDN